jgi:hypothetical protein
MYFMLLLWHAFLNIGWTKAEQTFTMVQKHYRPRFNHCCI